jgi:hypothetical protein
MLAGALLALGAEAQVMGGVAVDPQREPQPVSPSLGIWVGQIKVLTGRAFLDRLGEQRRDATLGMRLKENDVITTILGGTVGILFDDNSTLSLGPRTQIAIHKFAFNTTTHQGYFDTRIKRGTLAVQPGRIAQNAPEAMRVSTPAAVLRSKSATYLVSVEGDGND